MENNENNVQKRPKNRAVYGFRKNYPGSTGGSDYSIGESRKMQNRVRRNRVLFAVLLLVVFCISFVSVSTAIKLSKRPVSEKTQVDEAVVKAPDTLGKMKALYFNSDVFFSNETLENMLGRVRNAAADTVVIEFKTADGDLCYQSALPEAKNAYASENAYDNVKDFISKIKSEHIRVFALVSCFEDNKAATVMGDAAVLTDRLELWSDETTLRAWLNPYSQQARDYILDIITEICSLDVDGFVLTSVTFPVTSNSSLARYPEEAALTDRNSVIKDFISSAIERAGEREVILGVSFDAAFGSDLSGCGGNILDSEARYFAPDLRAASQTEDVLFGDKLYTGSSFAEYDFVKTYYTSLQNQQTENVFIPICDNAEYTLEALTDVKCETYIVE